MTRRLAMLALVCASCGSPAAPTAAPVAPASSVPLEALLVPRATPVVSAPPTPRSTPSPRADRSRPLRVLQHDGLDWHALALCESGDNPRAVSSTGKYRGLYQFSLATWHSVGGVGDPIDASRAEQTYRAQLLYRRSGRGQWPVCGRRL